MKFLLLSVACFLGIVGSLVQAHPQRVYVQKLPYYPPPTRAPRPIRVRRDTPVVVQNKIATNANGGQDVSLQATKVIGDDKTNAFASVFAQGNTKTGGTVTGATVGAQSHGVSGSITKANTDLTESFVKQAQANLYRSDLNSIDARVSQTDTKIKGINFEPQQKSGSVSWNNAYGVGASVSRDINKGFSDTLTKSVSANLFNNDRHSVDATVFKSHVTQDNGFKFDKTGGMVDYSHAGGHGLNAGLTRFSGIGKQASVGGYTNLFTSNDGSTKVNANAGGSRWLSGPLSGRTDVGAGVGVSYSGRSSGYGRGGCSG